MRRPAAILWILSVVGLLAASVDAFASFAPRDLLPSVLANGAVSTVLSFGMPWLALAVGVTGAVHARRAGARAWSAIFIALAVLGFVVPYFGCGVALVGEFQGGGGAAYETAASGLVLFPIVVFLAALAYRVGTRQPGGAPPPSA